MKNFNLSVLYVLAALMFSSCSTNETFTPEEQSTDLLKTYSIKRDASGAYSIDFQLSEGGEVESVVNSETNTKQFYLYSSDNASARKITQDLTIQGTQLKVGFVDANSSKMSHITLTDDNLKLAKNSTNKLKEYSITSNLDGTFNLDFEVANNVTVEFSYNQEIETYEIHLKDGKSSDNKFSKVLQNENGKSLKFDFVNYNYNANSKGKLSLIRKPQGIII